MRCRRNEQADLTHGPFAGAMVLSSSQIAASGETIRQKRRPQPRQPHSARESDSVFIRALRQLLVERLQGFWLVCCSRFAQQVPQS